MISPAWIDFSYLAYPTICKSPCLLVNSSLVPCPTMISPAWIVLSYLAYPTICKSPCQLVNSSLVNCIYIIRCITHNLFLYIILINNHPIYVIIVNLPRLPSSLKIAFLTNVNVLILCRLGYNVVIYAFFLLSVC